MQLPSRRCLQVAALAVSTSFISADDSTAAFAAEQRKADCKVTENTVSAEGTAYEVPGSAKIGYLSPGTKFLVMASLRHTDGETWVLLTSLRGTHVGWVMEKSVKRHLTVTCATTHPGFAPQPK